MSLATLLSMFTAKNSWLFPFSAHLCCINYVVGIKFYKCALSHKSRHFHEVHSPFYEALYPFWYIQCVIHIIHSVTLNIQSRQPISHSRHPIVQSAYPILQSRHPMVQSAYPISHSRHPILQSAYPIVQSAYPILQSAYPILQSAYPILQSAYPILQSAYPILQSATHTLF